MINFEIIYYLKIKVGVILIRINKIISKIIDFFSYLLPNKYDEIFNNNHKL